MMGHLVVFSIVLVALLPGLADGATEDVPCDIVDVASSSQEIYDASSGNCRYGHVASSGNCENRRIGDDAAPKSQRCICVSKKKALELNKADGQKYLLVSIALIVFALGVCACCSYAGCKGFLDGLVSGPRSDNGASAAREAAIAAYTAKAPKPALYLPKEVRGIVVVVHIADGKWQLTNDTLCSETSGLGWRKTKNIGDKISDRREDLLPWDSTFEGFDEGDGWIRFEPLPENIVGKQEESQIAAPTSQEATAEDVVVQASDGDDQTDYTLPRVQKAILIGCLPLMALIVAGALLGSYLAGDEDDYHVGCGQPSAAQSITR